ncbi:MAG: peroxiredoxin [Alphaproteobacteria bacterium]|nr:peroxiredoxin [Alphaproteobacteria bacterium]
MKHKNDTTAYGYDYANKCDCADDDNCGCDYPNNMRHDYTTSQLPLEHKSTAIIGRAAPDFTSQALLSNNTMIEHFNFYQYIKGHIAVLFFYPEDFSFTCPSELLMLNQELNAFNRRSAKILALSTDSIYTHIAWKELPPHKDGIADISFPLIADADKKISTAYGVLNTKGIANRATFVIDENKIIRHISLNDNKVWRNPTEIIRIIDILNYKGDGMTNCPPGWRQNFAHERPEPESITELYSHHKA